MAGIKFIKYHWSRLEKGSTVVITLSTAANVRLMDSTNFNAYKNGRKHPAIQVVSSGRRLFGSPFPEPVRGT